MNAAEADKSPRCFLSDSLILVPDADADRLQMMLAVEGYPQHGMLVYDASGDASLKASDFRTNDNPRVWDLASRMESAIRSLNSIREFYLHVLILPPLTSPSPLVISAKLTPSSDDTISTAEITGIEHLILKSVSDISPQDIRLTDHFGRRLGASAGFLAAPSQSDTLQVIEQRNGHLSGFTFRQFDLVNTVELGSLEGLTGGDWWGLYGGVLHYDGRAWTKHTYEDGLMEGVVLGNVLGFLQKKRRELSS